ncbi:biotin--[acetyl-CoA-carboxylase] ligase [Defluviimonas sp. WL0050]|uniref:biotin--[biotin carboxyl-carrier protein] ligase n=1 Tax=Albidovulum litorale TaxID=2984134 RepID=A0ABT2ZIX4_9RHOB|nr:MULTISPECIES: biotin--[acetyl-CoA-carboxylase] ligase [Defluviimonas]MCV2870997.1 biotin--[acetyl-CoA-carboxylase] ligase [Defluviimonas sp. WL0050]MDI3335009.1 biotin--[acetyl-CoA-carboxylase] ligase [Defluviimonas aestuarii]
MSAERSDPSAWPDGVARHVLGEVDSTNSEAQRLAPGLSQPTWILARRQTAARGRRGRAWVSPEGNFAATLVMRPNGDPAKAALRSFVAALALADALETVCGPGATITLKWPNDVLLNGGKVAGILLESAGAAGQVSHLAIGIGVNLIAAPPKDAVEEGALTPVSVQGETGIRIPPEEFLTYLAAAFARWEAQLTTYGFGPIRTAWLARAARLGQPIKARLPGETIEGTFETIAEDGELVLVTSQGKRHIPAADVFF